MITPPNPATLPPAPRDADGGRGVGVTALLAMVLVLGGCEFHADVKSEPKPKASSVPALAADGDVWEYELSTSGYSRPCRVPSNADADFVSTHVCIDGKIEPSIAPESEAGR